MKHVPVGQGTTSRHLFTVQDHFAIKGRGLMLVPGLVPQGSEVFRIGDPVVLRKPDGVQLRVAIGGLERFTTPASIRVEIPILIRGLSKEDVPIGTEVWSTDSPDPHQDESRTK